MGLVDGDAALKTLVSSVISIYLHIEEEWQMFVLDCQMAGRCICCYLESTSEIYLSIEHVDEDMTPSDTNIIYKKSNMLEQNRDTSDCCSMLEQNCGAKQRQSGTRNQTPRKGQEGIPGGPQGKC